MLLLSIVSVIRIFLLARTYVWKNASLHKEKCQRRFGKNPKSPLPPGRSINRDQTKAGQGLCCFSIRALLCKSTETPFPRALRNQSHGSRLCSSAGNSSSFSSSFFQSSAKLKSLLCLRAYLAVALFCSTRLRAISIHPDLQSRFSEQSRPPGSVDCISRHPLEECSAS